MLTAVEAESIKTQTYIHIAAVKYMYLNRAKMVALGGKPIGEIQKSIHRSVLKQSKMCPQALYFDVYVCSRLSDG